MADKDYTVTLSLEEICIVIASVETTLEDIVLAVFAGETDAIPFVEPIETLISKLKAVRWAEEQDA